MGGGWVGGGKIKNKDHLSQAESEVEAELGNIRAKVVIKVKRDPPLIGLRSKDIFGSY